MSALLACIAKELLLVRRDLHGLALLFLMPLAFVLIMSLAMQETFASRAGKQVQVLLVDADDSAASKQLAERIGNSGAFALIDGDGAQVDAALDDGRAHFALLIDAGFGERLQQPSSADEEPLLRLQVAPDTPRQTEQLLRAALREALGRQRVDLLLSALPFDTSSARADDDTLATEIAVTYRYRDDGRAPSAVQQSVPAWLVFGVFFIVIPLSNTLIRERDCGALRRLRSTNLTPLTQLGAKWLTFFALNQLQVVAMLAAGRYLVPLLGGEALQLNGSMAALALVAAALSVAAIGYALLIATLARSSEQATLAGGAGNIVLAALGGIMVPAFLMPATMQRLAELSPMAWGLRGFLDVLLRGGGIEQVWPEALLLTGFGAAALALAGLRLAHANE